MLIQGRIPLALDQLAKALCAEVLLTALMIKRLRRYLFTNVLLHALPLHRPQLQGGQASQQTAPRATRSAL